MMRYYAKVRREKGGMYLVEFPDLPGCLTEGETVETAIESAKDALSGWLAARCDRFLNVPKATQRRGRHFHPINVDIQVEFALRLRQMRQKRKLSQREIAIRLGISQQAYAKLEIPQSSNPSLTTIQKLSEALNVAIELKLVA